MRNEFLETSAPGEPLMMSAWRNINIKLDAQILQLLRHLLRAEVLFRTAAHEHIVYLTVELLCIGKDAVEAGLDIHTEKCTAEGSQGRELIQVRQHGVESLATAP